MWKKILQKNFFTKFLVHENISTWIGKYSISNASLKGFSRVDLNILKNDKNWINDDIMYENCGLLSMSSFYLIILCNKFSCKSFVSLLHNSECFKITPLVVLPIIYSLEWMKFSEVFLLRTFQHFIDTRREEGNAT